MIKAKLEAYRREKHRDEMLESVKRSIKKFLLSEYSDVNEKSFNLPNEKTEKLCQFVRTTNQKIEPKISKEKINLESADDLDSLEDETNDNPQCHLLSKIIYLLYFFLWIVLYIIAVQIEFGAVYFVISALILICLNTRSRPKKKGELSAYSVFNPNCEAIEGTLDASQFEREIRYGASSVH